MIIGAWPRIGETNPRNTYLYNEIENLGVIVIDLKQRPWEFYKCDFIHLHWPEKAFQENKFVIRCVKVSALIFLILCKFVAKYKIIQTIHNDYKYEIRSKLLRRIYELAYLQQVDMFAIPSQPSLRTLPEWILEKSKWFFLPLGNYPKEPIVKESRKLKHHLIIGRLTRKKGITETINMLRSYSNERFLICGSPEDDEYRIEIEKCSENTVNIKTEFKFLTDEEFRVKITEATSVIIDYPEGNVNSGVVTMALTCDTPVFITSEEMLKSNRKIYGNIINDFADFPVVQGKSGRNISMKMVAERMIRKISHEN